MFGPRSVRFQGYKTGCNGLHAGDGLTSAISGLLCQVGGLKHSRFDRTAALAGGLTIEASGAGGRHNDGA
jgi:hypothetical protein